MPIPMAVARFNRYVTNPIVRPIAGWAPGFCILAHVGRRSGREYRIPLNVFRSHTGFVFALTYGPETDWVKNVMAARGCTIRHRRSDFVLEHPRLLPAEEGLRHMPRVVQVVLGLLDVTEYLHLGIHSSPH